MASLGPAERDAHVPSPVRSPSPLSFSDVMSINDSFAPFTPPSSVSPFDFIMNAPRTFAEHLLAPMGLASWSLSLLDAALLLIAAAAFWGLSRRRWRARLPPGNEGLPLLGESLRLIAAYKSEDPEPFIDERVRRYGRLFTTHVFGERTVFSADPQFNRLALGAEGRTVQASYPSSIATLLGAHSLVVLQGAHHKRMHSLILNRLTSPAAIRDARLLPHIDRLVRQTLAAWPARVLLLDQAKKLTFDLTLKQLVSADPGEWAESLRREYLLLIEGFFSVPLPSFLSFTTYGRAIKARKKVEAVLKEVIRKRKQENAAAAAQTDGTDSEEKMMRARKKDMLGELMEEGMTEEAMVDLLLSLLMAGYETTSTMMTMAVKFLTDNPDVLAQLREEQEGIRAKRKGGDEEAALDWSDYKSMPFTQCVINEALRVANIVSGVFRRVITDIHYNGYTIPKGCRIFLSFRAVHLDADYFVNARTFEPTRWQNSDSIPGSNVYTPFGGGSRLCPGYELARVVVSVFLHYLVTGFSWEEAEKDRLVFFPTTRTLKGYPINVRRRRRLDDVE